MDWMLIGLVGFFIMLIFTAGYSYGRSKTFKECIQLCIQKKKTKKQKPKDLEYGNKS